MRPPHPRQRPPRRQIRRPEDGAGPGEAETPRHRVLARPDHKVLPTGEAAGGEPEQGSVDDAAHQRGAPKVPADGEEDEPVFHQGAGPAAGGAGRQVQGGRQGAGEAEADGGFAQRRPQPEGGRVQGAEGGREGGDDHVPEEEFGVEGQDGAAGEEAGGAGQEGVRVLRVLKRASPDPLCFYIQFKYMYRFFVIFFVIFS